MMIKKMKSNKNSQTPNDCKRHKTNTQTHKLPQRDTKPAKSNKTTAHRESKTITKQQQQRRDTK